jgi:hypothetical protein
MMTPVHPMCDKAGPLTRAEMLDMIRYEGLVGIGLEADILTAEGLEREGLVEVGGLHGSPCIVYTGPRP